MNTLYYIACTPVVAFATWLLWKYVRIVWSLRSGGIVKLVETKHKEVN